MDFLYYPVQSRWSAIGLKTEFFPLLNVSRAKMPALGFPVLFVIYEDILRNPEFSLTLIGRLNMLVYK